MIIRQINEDQVKKFVKQRFSDTTRKLLLEHAVYTHSYAIQFDHSEVEMFITLAKCVEKYFVSSVTVTLFDTECEQDDCEAVEDCISRRSSFHETMMINNPENPGMITVIAASIVSEQMHAIDYFTGLLNQ